MPHQFVNISPEIRILRVFFLWGLLKRQHLPFHSYYITVISPLLPMERYQLSQVSEAECLRSICCNEREGKKKVTEEKGAAKIKDHSGV